MTAVASESAPRPTLGLLRAAIVVSLGLAATVLAVMTATATLGIGGPRDLLTATLAHGVAGALALVAAGLTGRVEAGDEPALVALAFAIPLFGPALAWAVLLRPRAASIDDAHQAFDRSRSRAATVRRIDTARLRQPVVAYVRIAERGSLEERRNLLRQLAHLGEPRHLQVLRDFLRDSETELRLCAYAELTRIGERHERRIAAGRAEAERLAATADSELADSELAAAHIEVAGAMLGYGISGALEREMADYWLQQTVTWADRALEAEPDAVAAIRIRADALARLGDLETAWHDVESLPDFGDSVATTVLAAGIAFRRGDYRRVRQAAAALDEHDDAMPDWLGSVREGVR